MSYINYKIVCGVGEFRDCKFDGESKVVIRIDNVDGYIHIGEKVFAIKGGICCFPNSELQDGNYTPVLIRNGKVTPLESFKKKNGVLICDSIKEDTLRRILLRLENAEEEIAKLKVSSEKHEKAIFGNNIFGL